LPRDEVEAYKKDARSALTVLGVLPCRDRASRTPPKEAHSPVYLESERGGGWRSEISAGDMLRKGQLLGTIKNFLDSVLTRILRKVGWSCSLPHSFRFRWKSLGGLRANDRTGRL